MEIQFYQKKTSGISERFIVKGTLELTSPAIFQSSDNSGLADFVILRDEISQKPLLPGTSLAGALRSHLLMKLPPRDTSGIDQENVSNLFGDVDGKTTTRSWLIVEDAIGNDSGIELRDGVKIDAQTLTAEVHGKYDMELLAAGTTFEIAFELRLPRDEKYHPKAMLILFFHALHALESKQINLGGKKTRGLGECRVKDWKVNRYQMNQKQDLFRWLNDDHQIQATGEKLYQKLGFDNEPKLPADQSISINAAFYIDRSLIIRSYSTDPDQPDMVHLKNARGKAIIPGTSIAGVLRSQARRIAALKLNSVSEAESLVNGLFGSEEPDVQGRLKGSRLVVSEAVVEGGNQDIIQNRIKIDPFTGGTYSGALFDERPQLFGQTELRFYIANPTQQEVALLLFLLRDLWEGFISIGGETSIGRGKIKGSNGKAIYRGKEFVFLDDHGTMKIEPSDDELIKIALLSLNSRSS